MHDGDIERPGAITRLDDVVEASDAVLVARGDLGVELDIAEVPVLQKRVIAAAVRAGRPVIVATQMLQSMMTQPSPTRAEATDAANAVLDGADALMLSGETAIGRHPVLAVDTLRRIARRTEQWHDDMPYDRFLLEQIAAPLFRRVVQRRCCTSKCSRNTGGWPWFACAFAAADILRELHGYSHPEAPR